MQFLKEFQTLVTGAVGFLGVILTLVVNAWLARRQHDAEARLAREQREDERAHERSTVCAALLAELKINRDAIRRNIQRAREEGYDEIAESILVPVQPIEEAYRAFLPKLGLLSENEVSKVMTAYLSMEGHIDNVRLLAPPEDRSSAYVKLTGEAIHVVREMQEQLLGPIEQAITALEE